MKRKEVRKLAEAVSEIHRIRREFRAVHAYTKAILRHGSAEAAFQHAIKARALTEDECALLLITLIKERLALVNA